MGNRIPQKDMIKELEQLFKGNAFIEYVAQSKLSYIAREASVILSKISGGSYALEINDSAEFIIRDNKNGGAVRPSDTLSGGELFITSSPWHWRSPLPSSLMAPLLSNSSS